MLTMAECRVLAEQSLGLIAADCETELVLLERVLEKDAIAAFFYQSAEYVRTGNGLAMLAGNCPILVNRLSGAVEFAGTALPVETYIRHFEVETR